MEFVHGYFGQFQNIEAQIDRSADDYFRFLFCRRYKILVDDIPVEWGGLALSFFARVGLVISSRSILLRKLSMVFPKTILLRFL